MAQNAPGKHYREGISLIELFDRFPNDATPEEIAQALWTHPGKVEAPYTVCIASASNLTGLVKSSVECRRIGL